MSLESPFSQSVSPLLVHFSVRRSLGFFFHHDELEAVADVAAEAVLVGVAARRLRGRSAKQRPLDASSDRRCRGQPRSS